MHILFFSLILTFLFVHEMDAIRTKEWGMFIFLNRMPEEKAYIVFTLLHLPLYFVVFLVIFWQGEFAITILYYSIDLFLIGHGIIHFLFRNHKKNGFTSFFSKAIIYGMNFLALIHVILI